MTIIVSETWRKIMTSDSRMLTLSLVAANPKKMANTTSGNTLSSAAEVIGFEGAKLCSQSANVGGSVMCGALAPAPAMKLAADARSTGQNESQPVTNKMVAEAARKSSTVKSMTARATKPPVAVASATEAMPTTSSENTNGMTVIRSALSQSPPNACTT